MVVGIAFNQQVLCILLVIIYLLIAFSLMVRNTSLMSLLQIRENSYYFCIYLTQQNGPILYQGKNWAFLIQV